MGRGRARAVRLDRARARGPDADFAAWSRFWPEGLISGPERSIIVSEVMVVPPSDAWKLVLAVTLAAAIVVSLYARAPKRSVPGSELGRLVLSALGLYAVGGLASLTHHPMLAALVYAAGIAVCALAAWLSRGSDSEDPPDDKEPVDEQPPPEPDGIPGFDWTAFEHQFRAYAEGSERSPASVD